MGTLTPRAACFAKWRRILARPPSPLPRLSLQQSARSAGVAQLVAMGFSDAQARDALSKTGGSVQAATELLLG